MLSLVVYPLLPLCPLRQTPTPPSGLACVALCSLPDTPGLESLWWILTSPQRGCLRACFPFLFFGVLKALLFSKRLF